MVNLSNCTMEKELHHVVAENWNSLGPVTVYSYCTLSRKLKFCYGARNRFQEPSLELRSQVT
jgi:hypothetical protein